MFVIEVYYPFFQGTILTGNTCVTVLVIGGVEVFKMINTIETVLCHYFVDTSAVCTFTLLLLNLRGTFTPCALIKGVLYSLTLWGESTFTL